MVNIFIYTVEKERSNLYKMGKRYGLTSRHTIQASQQLDRILNLGEQKWVEKEHSCLCRS